MVVFGVASDNGHYVNSGAPHSSPSADGSPAGTTRPRSTSVSTSSASLRRGERTLVVELEQLALDVHAVGVLREIPVGRVHRPPFPRHQLGAERGEELVTVRAQQA